MHAHLFDKSRACLDVSDKAGLYTLTMALWKLKNFMKKTAPYIYIYIHICGGVLYV